MIVAFLLKTVLSRNAKYHLAHLSLCVFLFISSVLLFCLALACLHPGRALSDIYLIEAQTANLTVARTGYFHMCLKQHQNTTYGCAGLSSFKDDGGLAYVFAKHVSRPYFLSLSLAVTLVAFFAAIAQIFVHSIRDYFLVWLLFTFLTCMVSAVWQQVAVQAATRLIEDTVKRGTRAGAMVWTAFAFVSLALIIDVFGIERKSEEEYDDDSSKGGAQSIMSTIYKVGDGVPSI